MPRRIFPIDDWAPAQEAIYDEPTAIVPQPDTPGGESEVEPAPTPQTLSQRHRSVSLSFPWKHRPRSSLFNLDDLASKFPDLTLQPTKSNGGGSGNPESGMKRRRSSRMALDAGQHGRGAPKQKRHFKGMIRQASISIRGILPYRSSVLGDRAEQPQQRQIPQSSHAHSQSLGAFTALETSSTRPTTAHSTWRRLRQAASFRQSRIYPAHATLDVLEQSDASLTTPTVPMVGPANGPPIIPLNTGGAARAAAAAFQIEAVQRKWLYPDEYQNDRESGIGIAVTSTDSDLELTDGPETDLENDFSRSEYDFFDVSKVDFITQLPAELAISVLAYLDASGLAAAARVSRGWNTVVSNQHIWRESFLREKTRTYATSAPVRPGGGQGVPAIKPENDWKEIYRVKSELDKRWKEGKARPVYLNGHTDSIYCLQFDE
jgi:F-box and WD-40 domain protein 1/11